MGIGKWFGLGSFVLNLKRLNFTNKQAILTNQIFMKHLILPSFIFLILVSCTNNQISKTENKDEPDTYRVNQDDAEMNDAIKTAKQTLDKFANALKSGNKDYQNFALKIRFNAPNGGEHIWVSDITLKDNNYIGIVDNTPEATTEAKIGDTIQIENDHISDWMFFENQKLRGGYTLRLLRDRMTEEERNQFDRESGLIIED